MSERSERTIEHSGVPRTAPGPEEAGAGVLVRQAPEPADEVVPLGAVPPPEDRAPLDPAERLGPPPPTDRLRGWVTALALAVLGGLVRFWNLGFPTDKGTPVFDEKHYVPQAWQVLRNGGYEDNAGYRLVVHPPLGKQLIAVGEWLFGYDGWGWRFSAAAAGTVSVLLIVRIARRLTRSTLLGALAGVLLICDGVSHVQSRVGMLDIFLAVFVLAAFGCLLVDRDQVRQRLAVAVREGRVAETPWGPRLGFRWWRFGAGVLLGLSCGVKWSGSYFLAAFAVLCVFWDVTARRAAGVPRPWVGTVVRDLAPALWSLAVVPILAYLATWWAWLASETGVDRHAVGRDVGADSAFWFVPDALRSLWFYSSKVLEFHNSLVTPEKPHPWESKPWTWPMGLRPMLYYLESGGGAPGCDGRQDCLGAVMLVGTPAMWWLAFPVLGWALWRAVTRADWRYTAVLVAYAAGWLPWFVNLDRQMYYFYITPVAPFLVLGLVLVMGEVLGRARAGAERRGTGLLVVAIYTGLVVANFAWLWPILNGNAIPLWWWNAEMWLPSWR
ncbi:Dolichyl-phosphate-mannose-protein mannosyltransferase [Streptoalloteichus tenebrarius]|uniref:Polyprenol-phosphate-mannose--protein mannosyltransferase n=1 Tax=Streptoalloteichus tenebrarius (strain ATCC 17920 / DSM 40477 / JCM 4838 / CBS 697.72 / NBRC 16177 / NCIMB 11028 / NRRL B-12390 / A12253. 1 / ISP 5477) TaxID=1933 RepID=A0ABT1I424_STRSD|nr:Dolichyl-phosphate-mannose-protein mannosyltransferase [Streptoalloteichus tenebrarius]BFF01242.1 phospholipid carrier-dependent glycosyltransferase [Streptoalloteichus tenebrarius]